MIWREINITEKIDITGSCWVSNISKNALKTLISDEVLDVILPWDFKNIDKDHKVTYYDLYKFGSPFIFEQEDKNYCMRACLYRQEGYRMTDVTEQELKMFLDLFCNSVDDITKECPIQQDL